MLQIRGATQGDLPFIQTCAPQSAWETLSDEERRTAVPQSVTQRAQGMLAGLLGHPGFGWILIAELAGQPVGYLVGGRAPDTCTGEVQGLLLDVFVLPQRRRQGIGRRLLRAAEAHCAALGPRKVKMATGLHNQAALRLAATAGFQPDGLVGVKEW